MSTPHFREIAAALLIDVNGNVLLQQRDNILHIIQPGKVGLFGGHREGEETFLECVVREIAEETSLQAQSLDLIGVYDFQRMNQVIIAYHAVCEGEVKLSPELVDYKLYAYDQVRCWPAGTGHALADWLRSRGIEPQYMEFPRRD